MCDNKYIEYYRQVQSPEANEEIHWEDTINSFDGATWWRPQRHYESISHEIQRH